MANPTRGSLSSTPALLDSTNRRNDLFDMTIQIQKTQAEQLLLQQFEEVAPRLPGDSWVQVARRAAIGAFATSGLPHRRLEAWKYTDLRAGMKEAFPPALPMKVAALPDLHPVLGPLAELDCIRLLFVDGTFVSAEMRASLTVLPGVEYSPLSKVLEADNREWIKTRFALDAPAEIGSGDGSLSLNSAFVTDGAVIRIADGAELPVPLHVVFASTARARQRTTTRSMIEVGAGVKATIIESHVGVGDVARQSNAVTTLGIGRGALVSHIKVLAEGKDALHTGAWHVEVGTGAEYRAFQMTVDAGMARSQMFVRFAGEGATADLSGVMLARGGGHIDTTLLADHAVPACTSRELFKGVLRDHARAVFQGKLLVRPGAQKTDAKQMAQGLLLSEDAEFISKPELEIYADDVACGHGSTSGQIDDDLLFYLRARGIPKPQARALLVTAFIGEALETIRNEDVRECLHGLAGQWLESAA